MSVPRILRSERRWVLIFAFMIMLLTTLPYIVGISSQGEDWRFGGFVFGASDGNSYIAKMLRGSQGDWLYRTPYTAQPQQGALIYFPYYLLGKLARPPDLHLKLVVLFHVFRIIAGFLMITASYDFLSIFLRQIFWRRWGLVLVSLGGGLGWLLMLFGRQSWQGSLPLAFYSPETFGFLSLLGLPHLALARALFLWGLKTYLCPEGTWWPQYAGKAQGLLWLLMSFFQPLSVVVAWSIVGAHIFFLRLRLAIEPSINRPMALKLWRDWLHRGIWGIILSSPLVIYTMIVFTLDPVLQAWSEQNIILSPHPFHYLIAYGLLVPAAVLGVRALHTDDTWRGWMLFGWTLILPFLIYAPVGVQRRLIEGYWVALVVLAFYSLDCTVTKLRKRHWLMLMAFPSTLLILVGSFLATTRPNQLLFQPTAQVRAFQHLASHAEADSVVLTAFETGNLIPAWAPVFVPIGHGPESIDLAIIRPQVESFYEQTTSDAQRIIFLSTNNIEYVFFGPNERALGNWNPKESKFLSVVYDQDGYSIFTVTDN